jgi:molybdate transport system substrate-binding protein
MSVRGFIGLICILLIAPAAAAESVSVAVAANFADALKRLQPAFERESGHTLRISSASTGTLYAQIVRGAPFDVFLAADRRRPELLIEAGLAEASSAFIYARGRLVLWSPDSHLIDGTADVLRTDAFEHLALANPRTAPYGAAAVQVLGNLGLDQALARRLVLGENISQAWHFVASGNAELGFVALSQPLAAGRFRDGSHWLVPPALYDPVEQMAVLVSSARNVPAARALMQFLQTDGALRVLMELGYDTAHSGAGGEAAAPGDRP